MEIPTHLIVRFACVDNVEFSHLLMVNREFKDAATFFNLNRIKAKCKAVVKGSEVYDLDALLPCFNLRTLERLLDGDTTPEFANYLIHDERRLLNKTKAQDLSVDHAALINLLIRITRLFSDNLHMNYAIHTVIICYLYSLYYTKSPVNRNVKLRSSIKRNARILHNHLWDWRCNVFECRALRCFDKDSIRLMMEMARAVMSLSYD